MSMNQKFTTLLLVLFLGFWGSQLQAQTTPNTWVYGCSAFQDSLWAFDTTNAWTVVQRTAPSLSGSTITGINGMAMDPCTYQTYAILKVSGVSGRVLATMDLASGVCTQVGNLGDNFSSLAFDRNGQLYGLKGDGASTNPESFFSINKTTGTPTLLTTLGNGADGEVMAYHFGADKFYHWSGNGTVVFEKFLGTTPFTVSGIVGSLGSGETFGATYINPNRFLISTIQSNFRYVDTLGNLTAAVTSTPDDIRGTVIPPRFGFSADTVCPKYDTLSVGVTGVSLYDIIYLWGDGTSDTVTSGGASHVYTSQGNQTLTILLDNGFCTDTFMTKTIRVNNAPSVAIVGDSLLCPGETLIIAGTSGGTSQWYMNGSPIPGETNATLSVTQTGSYNMLKTNQNGCTDSASVGFVVTGVPNPTVSLGGPQSGCTEVILDAGNPGSAYLWSNGQFVRTITVTATGSYSVEVTDSNGCMATDTAAVTIFGLPTVTYNESQNILCDTSAAITLTPGSPAGGTYSGTGVTGSTFNPATSGVGTFTVTYSFTDGNGCTNTDSSDIEVTLCIGLEDGLARMGVEVFPNPSSQTLHIRSNTTSGNWQAGLWNSLGQQVMTQEYTGGNLSLNVSELPNGIYYLKVHHEGAEGTVQLLIQH